MKDHINNVLVGTLSAVIAGVVLYLVLPQKSDNNFRQEIERDDIKHSDKSIHLDDNENVTVIDGEVSSLDESKDFGVLEQPIRKYNDWFSCRKTKGNLILKVMSEVVYPENRVNHEVTTVLDYNSRTAFTIKSHTENVFFGGSEIKWDFECDNFEDNFSIEDYNFDGKLDFSVVSGCNSLQLTKQADVYVQTEDGRFVLDYDLSNFPHLPIVHSDSNLLETIMITNYWTTTRRSFWRYDKSSRKWQTYKVIEE